MGDRGKHGRRTLEREAGGLLPEPAELAQLRRVAGRLSAGDLARLRAALEVECGA